MSASNVDTIKAYIEDVRATTGAIKGVNDLDVIIKEYGKDLKEHDTEVKNLNWDIKEKDKTITELSRDLNKANETISKQDSKTTFLQTQLSRFKDLWEKVKKIFRVRVDFDKNEHFIKVADEFYEKGILNKDGTDVIKTEYQNKKKYDR